MADELASSPSLWSRIRAQIRARTPQRGNWRHRRPPLIHVFSNRVLLVIPVLLAIATVLVLFVHSDVNVALLYSQCQARSRLPGLSRIPLLGGPSCFLVSFFQEALAASRRAFAVMGVVLAFVAGLLTVSTVEAARICNGPSLLIAYPTGAWLVFNLVGGAVVWELVILPAFFQRSRQILAAAGQQSNGAVPRATNAADVAEAGADEEAGGLFLPTDPNTGSAMRHLGVVAEVVAIPAAVAIGYILPSVLMLFTDAPLAIIIWLFFPVYVSLLRQGIRYAIVRIATSSRTTLHLESHRPSLLAVYAIPIICSTLAHGVLLWNVISQTDDRREMTKSTLQFIEIDFFFVVLTVLYWVLVEAGWPVVLVVLGWSVVLGPGAGLCIGWIYRETQLGFVSDSDGEDERSSRNHRVNPTSGGGPPGEETPLLR